MNESTLIEFGSLFLALSDKTRLRMLTLMIDGEVSVGFLASELGESQPKTSRHLAYLRTAGLVSARRDGKWVYYGIYTPQDASVAAVLDTTLRAIVTGVAGKRLIPQRAVGPRDDESVSDISAEPYIPAWSPTQLEIHLL